MQAHCTSPGTTTHAAAPKNDVMLFVAVLPLGEPENSELVALQEHQYTPPTPPSNPLGVWVGFFQLVMHHLQAK